MVTYEPSPDEKMVECLSFGPIELAPHLRAEIESNLLAAKCVYTPLVRANPLGRQIKNKGIRVNTRADWALGDLPETKPG